MLYTAKSSTEDEKEESWEWESLGLGEGDGGYDMRLFQLKDYKGFCAMGA